MNGGRSSPGEQTLLGIVFAFDVESLGAEQAFLRAWQLWMERLDPAELRGAALYDGAIALPGLPLVTMIAVSGPAHVVSYVREAFAAPDLAAYPGIAPITHRFIEGAQLPRERLVLRGFVNDQRQFVARQEDIPLDVVAQHAEWGYSRPVAAPLPPSPPMPIPAPVDATAQETRALHAAPTEGATQVMMRLWQSSFRAGSPVSRHRRLFGIVGTILIIGSLGYLGMRLTLHLANAQATPTPTGGASGPNAVMVVAPLALRLPCAPGQQTQFTISNNGNTPLIWQSNGAQFEPPLSLSLVNDTIPAGDSEVISLTASEFIATTQRAQLIITSNGGTAQVQISLGGCPRATTTPHS